MMKKILLFLISFLCFSTILLAQEDKTVPVRIVSINAAPFNSYNKLTWKTACFLEYANFVIQRSYDGSNYTSINSFTADRLRCLQPFNYSDSGANQMAGRIFYRLKVGDKDGRVYNSRVISVITVGHGIEVNSFVPTIVSNSADVSISSSGNDNAVLTVINAQGGIVSTQKINLNRGVNTIHLSVVQLQPGKYWLSISNSKRVIIRTISFIKQ